MERRSRSVSVEMVVGLFCWPVRREPEEAEVEAIGLAFLNRCAAFELKNLYL